MSRSTRSRIGAVDYLSKPKIDLAATLKDYGEELIEKIKTAAKASVRALDPRRAAAIAAAPGAQRRRGAAEGRARPSSCAPPTGSSPSAPPPAARRPSRRS